MSDEPRRRLTRGRDRKLAGVASGLAEYLDADPTLVRLAAVLAAVVSLGAAVVAYVVLWVVMPAPDGDPQGTPSTGGRVTAIVLALALVIALAGGIASWSVFSLPFLSLAPPLWIVVIGLLAWLLVRSRGATTS